MRKVEIYNYLKGVKNSLGYIPKRFIVNAYNITDVSDEYKSIQKATNDTYSALKSKSIWSFS